MAHADTRNDSDSTDYGPAWPNSGSGSTDYGDAPWSSDSESSDYGPAWDVQDVHELSQLADALAQSLETAVQHEAPLASTGSGIAQMQRPVGVAVGGLRPHVRIEYEQDQAGPDAASAEDAPTITPLSPPPLDLASPPLAESVQSTNPFVLPPAVADATRSPLQRFRPAGRALSVTDVVSPAWCELQWAWTLSRHGRKRPTPQMKAGTRVHRKLEDEVSTKVTVATSTKEDRFGLRLWNVVQGLHTLRDTGLAREVEVWGIIDGHVVNGIIDELSYICPDRGLEEETLQGLDEQGPQIEPDSGHPLRSLRSPRMRTERVYIGDVKTRAAAARLPDGAGFKPTLLQLMLYRLILAQMVNGQVSVGALAARYAFSADASFSDSFIASIGSLNDGYHIAPESSQDSYSQPSGSQDPLDLLTEHNSPRKLWGYMLGQAQGVLTGRLADVLKAEYRDRETGEIIGTKTFLYREDIIIDYVREELTWWTGQRDPVGVPVQEAFKCRSCEFADECSWRLGKIEEAVALRRNRTRSQV